MFSIFFTLGLHRDLSGEFNFVFINILIIFVTGNVFLSFIVLSSAGIIVTGDPVSTMKSFSVLSILTVMVAWILWSLKSFISVNIFIDLSVSLSLVSSGSVISLFSCQSLCSNLHASAKCPFLQLWLFDSRSRHLWFGFQFGASQYLQVSSFDFFFGLVPYCPACFVLCMGSSLMSFARFDIRASGMLFFLFFSLVHILIYLLDYFQYM